MRPNAPVLATVALALMVVTVLVGGSLVAGQPTATATVIAVDAEIEGEPAASVIDDPTPRRPAHASRDVLPSLVAPPGRGADDLQWEAPRQPLSELSLALPPKPKARKPLLYQPVAAAAGVIEAGGRTITIDGVVPVAGDEICAGPAGGDWPCGRAARTAFRAFLRGRAVTCDFPDGEAADEVTSTCRLGKQDAGEWLVSNGWARARPGGPYAGAEEKAKADKLGIFGSPPDTSGLPSVPAYETLTPLVDQPVLFE